MKKAFLLATGLTLGIASFAVASPDAVASSEASPGASPAMGSPLNHEDKTFLEDAIQGGLLEVRLGQVAVKQASSPEVKTFGQRMIDDHSQLNSRLAQLAQQKALTVPQELDKKHQEAVDKLSKMSGPAFDREYMHQMVEDHKQDLKDFEKESREAKDVDVKALVSSALPVLQEHLALAKQVQDKTAKK